MNGISVSNNNRILISTVSVRKAHFKVGEQLGLFRISGGFVIKRISDIEDIDSAILISTGKVQQIGSVAFTLGKNSGTLGTFLHKELMSKSNNVNMLIDDKRIYILVMK